MKPIQMGLRERLIGGGVLAVSLLLMYLMWQDSEGGLLENGTPLWIALLFGGAFAGAGLLLLTSGTPLSNLAGQGTVAMLLLGLFGFVHWGAFGPGVRECTRTVSFLFFINTEAAGDFECRAVLAILAVMADSFLLGALCIAVALANPNGPWARPLKRLALALIGLSVAPLILLALLGMVLAGHGSEVKENLTKLFRRHNGNGDG